MKKHVPPHNKHVQIHIHKHAHTILIPLHTNLSIISRHTQRYTYMYPHTHTHTHTYINIYIYHIYYIYIYIYHHVVLLARIFLTLSRHFSLSSIASGRSSGLHPVSSHSCCKYVLAGRPAFARPYVGVHRST